MPEKKPSLLEFQDALSQAVMRPLGAGDSMRRDNRAAASQFIKANDRLTSFDRLQIYNQQYWWRLLGSFSEDFRGLRAVLGERKFNKLATSYLTEMGSASWNLRNLGSRLAGYLEDHPDLLGQHAQLGLDMARVEWARVIAFDGEPRPLLDVRKFARLAPSRMVVGIQPYITLVELTFPVDHMLKRLKRSESGSASNAVSGGPGARRARLTSKPLAQPLYLAIHRLDLLVYYKRLDPEAYLLLTGLRDGLTLENACDKAFSRSTDSPEVISGKVRDWFTAWMSFGWLCKR